MGNYLIQMEAKLMIWIPVEGVDMKIIKEEMEGDPEETKKRGKENLKEASLLVQEEQDSILCSILRLKRSLSQILKCKEIQQIYSKSIPIALTR
jgi:hypothetical protein